MGIRIIQIMVAQEVVVAAVATMIITETEVVVVLHIEDLVEVTEETVDLG